jgi:HD superfamily phosphohydrolase
VRKYNQLVHSTLDLDRMDYLVRDAIFTGVPFGRIDLHYLLSNLDIDADGNLVLHEKAATAVEHFIVARYFMSKAVYLHKTVFGFEAMMRQTLFLLRDAGKLWQDGGQIKKLVRHATAFLTFDDGYIEGIIQQRAENTPVKTPLGRLSRAIRDRKPPKLVAQVSSLTPKAGDRSEEMTRFVARRHDRLVDAAKNSGIPMECWLWEDPKDISFEKFGPFMTLTEAATTPLEEASELVYLIDRNGVTRPLIEDKSSIIHHLSGLRFHMARLYVVEDDPAKITKAEKLVRAWSKP